MEKKDQNESETSYFKVLLLSLLRSFGHLSQWQAVPELPWKVPLGALQGRHWPGAGLPPSACSLQDLGFLPERLHHRGPGDLEGSFIKAGDREVRKGLG